MKTKNGGRDVTPIQSVMAAKAAIHDTPAPIARVRQNTRVERRSPPARDHKWKLAEMAAFAAMTN